MILLSPTAWFHCLALLLMPLIEVISAAWFDANAPVSRSGDRSGKLCPHACGFRARLVRQHAPACSRAHREPALSTRPWGSSRW